MSLERRPPILPPEKLQKQSKSYRRQRRDYALVEAKGQDVGLIAGGIGALVAALIVGSLYGGIAAGIVAAIVTFIATLIAIFWVYYSRASKALDQIKAREIARLQTETDLLKSQLEELRKWKVTFKVGKQSQMHYSHIEEMSHFTANLLMQFENKGEQDLTMYRVDLHLYRQEESGEEKKLDFNVSNLKIEYHPKTSRMTDFSRGLKLIAGELSTCYWFKFDMQELFKEPLTADCFLRVTMYAMNQYLLPKDYIIVDWGFVGGYSYISERHQEPSQNVGLIPSSYAVSDSIGDPRQLGQAEAESQAKREYKIERLKEFIKEGEGIGWIRIDRDYRARQLSYEGNVTTFLRQYYDESHVSLFEREGVTHLQELLKELLEQ